ncbi:hypothetical protein QAD02_003187 [Eretmocerus hayati]|uniref:Uncharacterized protein n=1 Tax=Eretmocerus hayati TaxID=131215 RepID=A0ACC2NM98_9HYME|nr:hypothetical protein QAD02_003187 [Eretmocerus hayati]
MSDKRIYEGWRSNPNIRLASSSRWRILGPRSQNQPARAEVPRVDNPPDQQPVNDEERNGRNVNDEEEEESTSSNSTEDEALQDPADRQAQEMWREALREIGGSESSDSEDSAEDEDANGNEDNNFENLRNFLSRQENNERINSRVQVSKAELLLGLITFALVFTLPQDGLIFLLKLINICFGINFLPATRYLVDKMFMNRDCMTYHACCSHCGSYISQFDRRTVSVRCRRCGRVIRVKDPMYRDFFAILDSRPEVAALLKDNWGYYNDIVRRRRNPETVSDITDGILYRRFVSSLPEHLRLRYATCIFNTDGVPVFKSSNISIWPIQLVINELPYDVRTANPVTCAIWFGKSKPDMDIYLDIFVREMTELENNGLTFTIGEDISNIKLFAICSCVDSMAQAPMQGLQQCGGYYSCNWCYIRGNWVESGQGGAVKYLNSDEPREARTQESMVADVHESHESGVVIRGVNHTSRLLNLRFFDIIKGFVPDFMHFLCLGIAKTFFEFWLRMMTPLERREIDSIISSIKVPNAVQRLSRSIRDRKYWKSKEWENWILYYSLPVMMQIESLAALTKHWAFLVQGFGILMCPSITRDNIRRAHESFVKFVTQTKLIYGPAMMKFNVHQLLHAAQSVINWGPFWARYGYCFESNNGTLKKNIHSPKGVINQLCRFVSMKQSALIMTQHVTQNNLDSPIIAYVNDLQYRRPRSALTLGTTRFFGPYKKPTQDERDALRLSDNSRAYRKMVKDRCQYGTDTARATRSDNSYAKTSDGRFIRTRKFIVDNSDNRSFAACYILNVEPASIDEESPIVRVLNRSQDKSFIRCNEIATICVCTKVNDATFLTVPPNLLRC